MRSFDGEGGGPEPPSPGNLASVEELPEPVQRTWEALRQQPVLGIYGFHSPGWLYRGRSETEHGPLFFFGNCDMDSATCGILGLAAIDWSGRSFWVSLRSHTDLLEKYLLEAWMAPSLEVFGHSAITSFREEPTEDQFRECVAEYARHVPIGP